MRRLFVLFALVVATTISALRRPATRISVESHDRRVHLAANKNNYGQGYTIEGIRSDIEAYMAKRALSSDSQFDANPELYKKKITSLKDKVVKKQENPLAMLQPSGWFKDEIAAELAKRTDKTQPDRPHPLSFVELRKYGFENLSDAVVSLGGPHAVGELVGIEWNVPEMDIEEWDESLRPVRQELFTLDMRGSLSLGSAFDDNLASAAALDLEAVKEAIEKSKDSEDFDCDDVLNSCRFFTFGAMMKGELYGSNK